MICDFCDGSGNGCPECDGRGGVCDECGEPSADDVCDDCAYRQEGDEDDYDEVEDY